MRNNYTVKINTSNGAEYPINTYFQKNVALRLDDLNRVCDYVTGKDFSSNINQLFNNASQYILNARVYPFNVAQLFCDVTGSMENLNIGGVNITYKSGATNMPVQVFPTIDTINHTIDLGSYNITEHFNSFLDYAPYTKIYIYLPYLTFTELDVNEIMGKTINIKYYIDLTTGVATAYILANNALIYQTCGNIAIDIPLGATNAAERAKSIMQLVTSAAGVVAGAALGQTALTAITATSTLNNAFNAFQKKMYRGNNPSTRSGIVSPNNVYFIIERPIELTPSNIASLKGLPCEQTEYLFNLTGYTKIEELHLEYLNDATENEKEEILNILKSGFII